MSDEMSGFLPKPLEKMIQTIQSAIGKWFEPLHIKRLGSAVSEVAETMPIRYERDGLMIDGTDYAEIEKRAKARQNFQENKRQQNIENIISQAVYSIEAEAEVSDEPVDEDWLMRFFRIAEDVSTEEMQLIWGRILAGEVKTPGSFSMRTLETIRNLSRFEAELFQKIFPLVIRHNATSDYYLPSDYSRLKKYDISLYSIMRLSESGLLNYERRIAANIEIPKGDYSQVFSNNRMCRINNISDHDLSITLSAYALTTVGVEMLEIFDYQSDESFFDDVVEGIFEDNKDSITATIYKLHNVLGDKLFYESNPIKTYGVNQS